MKKKEKPKQEEETKEVEKDYSFYYLGKEYIIRTIPSKASEIILSITSAPYERNSKA